MNNRQLLLDEYISVFKKVLAKNKINMVKDEMSDGLLEEYALRLADKTGVGETIHLKRH
jgi:hypothetical protein